VGDCREEPSLVVGPPHRKPPRPDSSSSRERAPRLAAPDPAGVLNVRITAMEITWAERGLAVIGLVIGAGLSYIALDLLTGGMLTRSLTRSTRLASVTQLPVQEPPAS